MKYEIENYQDHAVVILYRPMGQKEYDLVKATEFKIWPERLPEQPIFYPVTNESYACEIAEKWNTKDTTNGSVGYVSKFRVDREFMNKYEVQIVGGNHHTEWWIPAEDLHELNNNIIGLIEIIKIYKN